MRPVAAIPLTDIPDAVAEIRRVHKLGLRALMLPEIPPVPYWARDYEPVWNVAEELGLPIFIHVATGGVKVKEDASVTGSTVKGLMTAMNMGKGQLTDDMVAGRTMGGGNTAAASPSKIMADLIGGGVPERHPGLQFTLVEFGASWLVSYMAFMDKSWRRGTGQDPKWWLGFWEEGKSPYEQPAMGRLFNINEKWPYPLKPTEYVRRQFHIQFADDPVAVQARHITGVSHSGLGQRLPARRGHLQRHRRGHRRELRQHRLRRGPRRDPGRDPGEGGRLRHQQEAGGRAAAGRHRGELTRQRLPPGSRPAD